MTPTDLWQVPNPPEVLFVQGRPEALRLLERLPESGLAIVGTRQPQPRSVSFLERQMIELTGSQLIIVSGMARGIDAIAHAGAIRAGLPTLGILGTALDIPYPRATLPLREKILQHGGLIVSELPPGTRGFPSQFIQRNRLIAGWSKAVLVAEAAQKSGALNTAYWAREQNRMCFAVPCFPGDPSLSGNQSLIDRDHAIPFWGPHTLGAAWLQLAARPAKLKPPRQKAAETLIQLTDTESLCLEVKRLTHSQGGAPISEALNWALQGGWPADRFFAALSHGLQTLQIQDQRGTLISVC